MQLGKVFQIFLSGYRCFLPALTGRAFFHGQVLLDYLLAAVAVLLVKLYFSSLVMFFLWPLHTLKAKMAFLASLSFFFPDNDCPFIVSMLLMLPFFFSCLFFCMEVPKAFVYLMDRYCYYPMLYMILSTSNSCTSCFDNCVGLTTSKIKIFVMLNSISVVTWNRSVICIRL